MPTVSVSFLLAVAAIAAASGTISLFLPSPVFSMTALVLALYAIHGLALRLAIREHGDPQEELAALQLELWEERTRLEAEQAERTKIEKEWIGLVAGGGH